MRADQHAERAVLVSICVIVLRSSSASLRIVVSFNADVGSSLMPSLDAVFAVQCLQTLCSSNSLFRGDWLLVLHRVALPVCVVRKVHARKLQRLVPIFQVPCFLTGVFVAIDCAGAPTPTGRPLPLPACCSNPFPSATRCVSRRYCVLLSPAFA